MASANANNGQAPNDSTNYNGTNFASGGNLINNLMTPPASSSSSGQTNANPNPASNQTTTTNPTSSTGNTAQSLMSQYPGMNAQLAQFYASNNITPGAAGSGLTDWQYWNNAMTSGDPNYYISRMQSDLAGNGPDGTSGMGGSGSSTNSSLSPDIINALMQQSLEDTNGLGSIGGFGGSSSATAGPPPTAATPPPGSVDPFASIGGGVYLSNGGWIPASMAQQEGISTTPGSSSGSSTSSTASPSGGITIPGVGTIGNSELLSTNSATPSYTPLTVAGQQALTAPLPTANTPTNPGTPTVAPATYTESGDIANLVNQLTGIAGQSTVINPNDPTIQAQVNAYSAQQEQAARQAINTAAEQSSPYSTGQQANNARMIQEQEGQNVGQFEGQVMQNTLNQRIGEIQNALSTMGSVLTSNQQAALQTELANLNAQLSQAGMNVQNTQFYAGLSTQNQQFVDQITQSEQGQDMQDALSRYTLYQQNSQFAASLAQQGQTTQLQAQLQEAGMSQQNQEFLLSLAQNGQIAEFQQQFQRLQLAQDNNQFIASLAQQNNLAQLQSVFNYAQLAQQNGQFTSTQQSNAGVEQNYFDNLYGYAPGTAIPGISSGS